MDESGRIVATLNRTTLQRDNPPLYQAIKRTIQVALPNLDPSSVMGNGSAGSGNPAQITMGTGLEIVGTTIGLNRNGRRRTLLWSANGFGSSITTGTGIGPASYVLDMEVPYEGIIVAGRLFADTPANVVVDFLSTDFDHFPDGFTSITGGNLFNGVIMPPNPLTMVGTDHMEDKKLIGWFPNLRQGDIVRFVILQNDVAQILTMSLTVEVHDW